MTEITNEIKEYLYQIKYKKYSKEEIFQILFLSSLYSYANYSRGIFCTDQRGTKEEEVKQMVIEFIDNPTDLSEITDNFTDEHNTYYISISDFNSINHSISLFDTKEFDEFFKKYNNFEFEDTFEIFKTLEEKELELLKINGFNAIQL